MDACHYFLLLVHEFVLMYEYGHGINTGGNMLKGDSVLLKRLQYLSAETDLGVHHIFFNIHRAEAFFTGDTGDDIFGLLAGASHDPGTVVFRRIGIANIDGNTLLAYREDGILMQYGSSHICQLAKFAVGDGLNSLGMIDDSGICDQETGHIRPILIDIRFGSLSHNRTGNIGSASGEGLYRSVRHRTVESGNYRFLALCQSGTKYFVGLRCIKLTVFIEENYGCRINEIIA